jgi:tellurite resistance protein
MHPHDQKAILAIALHAAIADGSKDEREREEIRRMAESLAPGSATIDLRMLVQDVMLKRVSLDDAAAALKDDNLRLYAYEMALCVCEADGRTTDSERAFLDRLKSALGTGKDQARAIEQAVEPFVPAEAAAAPRPVAATSLQPGASPAVNEAEVDRSILNYALLNGALELLPQSWASMAIISALQLRPHLVQPLDAHRLGRAQLLREEAHAQLFQQPAQFLHAVVHGALALGHQAPVALLLRAQLGQRAASRAGSARYLSRRSVMAFR